MVPDIPNVQQLHSQRNVAGLIRAVHFPGEDQAATQVRIAALGCLAEYYHVHVVVTLIDVVLRGVYESWAALDALGRLLHPECQDLSSTLAWWETIQARPHLLTGILQHQVDAKRLQEWKTARQKIYDLIPPPIHIQLIMEQQAAGYPPLSAAEQTELASWSSDRRQKISGLLEAELATLDAFWRAEDALWEKEAALLKITPKSLPP